jgi:hypothetical protein
MELGFFDKQKSKNQAKTYLEKSIYTLGVLLNCNTNFINKDSINPHEVDTAMYYGFEILKTEIEAYNKL